MKIGGLQKLSTVDYPGHLGCTIFLTGCNLRCKFCHNPGLVSASEETKEITLEEVMSFLEKRKGLLEGVCITGGEPTFHEDLEDLIRPIKEMGYKIKLDTNGTNPEAVKNLIDKGLINYIAVDIKATVEKYEEVVGCWVNTDNIRKTIEIVLESNIDYEFRTTFLPDLDKRDIREIAESLAGSKRYIVQQFRNNITLNQECSSMKPYHPAYIMDVVENIRPLFATCEARGVQ